MAASFKASLLRTLRSRQDYDLFRIILPRYDPQTYPTVKLYLKKGQFLSPQAPLLRLSQKYVEGQITSERDQDIMISTVGYLEQVHECFQECEQGLVLRPVSKISQLELCRIRVCQHYGEKQSINDKQECPLCMKPIWIYCSKQNISVTSEILLQNNPDLTRDDLQNLEWSIIVNQPFTPTTTIAKSKEKEVHFPILGKAVYLRSEGEKGNELMIIVEMYCRHEKIVQHRCQNCLQVLKVEQLVKFNRYLFQLGKSSSRSLVRGSALAQQQQQYIDGLLTKKKAILILDLDNTILHSCQMHQLTLSTLLSLQQYFIMPKIDPGPNGSIKQDYIVVKMRPYFEEFLFIVNKYFELYVYTKGTRIYAQQICRWVRGVWAKQGLPYDLPTWPPRPNLLANSECFSPHRLISRNQDSNLDSKSLQNILPTRTQYHLILDDRRDVWSNSLSWFYTRDYYYFLKSNPQGQPVEDYLESPQSPLKDKLTEYYSRMRQDYEPRKDYKIQINSKQDNFLLFTCHALKKIHYYFFSHLQKEREEKQKIKPGQEQKQSQNKGKTQPMSIARMMQKVKLFLSKKKIRFFLAPGDEGISTTRRAIKMGAIILDSLSIDTPDYVVRGSSFLKYAQNQILENKNNENLRRDEKLISDTLTQKNEHRQRDSDNSEGINIQKQKSAETHLKKNNKEQIDYQKQLSILQNFYKSDVPVVSQTWVLASYQFSYRFNWQEFKVHPLVEEDPKIFTQILEREGQKIRKEIRKQMDQL